MLPTADVSPVQIRDSDIEFAQTSARWQSIGLCTLPAERKTAEAAIRQSYRAAKLDAPLKIVWCGSPLAQGIARAAILDPEFLNVVMTSVWNQARNKTSTNFSDNVVDSFCTSVRLFDVGAMKQELMNAVRTEVRMHMTAHIINTLPEKIRTGLNAQVWDGIWEIIWNSVWDALWDSIDKGIRKAIAASKKKFLDEAILASLGNCIGRAVKPVVCDEAMEAAWGNVRSSIASKIRVRAWDALWGPLQVSIWEKLAFPIGACVRQAIPDCPQACGFGQHDAYWLAFHDYFRDKAGLVSETDGVSGLMELAKSAGWFLPHAYLCWVCERPLELAFDQDGKLHSDDGPAVKYPDGWNLWGNHGLLRFGADLGLESAPDRARSR